MNAGRGLLAGSYAVTGVGMVSAVGRDVPEAYRNLCAGRSAVAPLRGFDRSRYRSAVAYEIDDRVGGRDEPGRATRFLTAALAQALADAGLPERLDDVPVLVGTGLRELRSVELRWRTGVHSGIDDLHFGTALRERFGARRTYTFCNACSASMYALALATDLLAGHLADTVVVAGVDTITESMFGLLDRMNAAPPEAVRPFDRQRKGVLMGDGAAAVVLRRPDRTPQRARLRAVAVNCDAYHVTAPDAKSVASAIREAHERAGVSAPDVDVVFAHGTGTVLNDEAEALALGEVFTSVGARPLVTGLKSMTGHTSGASGLMSLIVAGECLRTGTVPPTVGLTDPVDAAAALRFVRDRTATGTGARLAQVDAFGFGGVNAVAVLERPPGALAASPVRTVGGGR